MTEILENLSQLMLGNLWLAPLLALVAGAVASFMPCSLSSVPLVIGYVGGVGQKDTKKAFRLSVTFAIGSALTFTTLGVIASAAGSLIGASSTWWYLLLGVLMVLMALQVWGIFEIIPSSYLLSKNTKTGYAGAFIAGILGGIFSSPCSTPVLIALLALVAGQGDFLRGILLLFAYSVGHGILAVVAGTSVGLVSKLAQDERYGKAGTVFKIVMGAAILVIGFYMFYLAF
ncbi:MAG: cytochrome c biogenesis protein CcdA [Actinobacteria bacterium]|nr:cytochrome c biogenesis protein CcdA [Actinomycetota bacterium]